MAQQYKVYRSNDYDLRFQISEYLNSLSDRLGGPDDPTGYDGINARWRGQWVQQEYYAGDMVVDGLWLMIANKTTTDAPKPQPVGLPFWTIETGQSDPAWTVTPYPGTVFSGLRVVPDTSNMLVVNATRIWIQDANVADARYQTIIVDNNTGTIEIGREVTGDIIETGVPQWVEINITPTIVFPGDDFSLYMQQWNSANTTEFNHPWVYAGTSQTAADPGTGNLNSNNQNTVLRFNYLDDDGIDRSTDLQTIIPGTTLRIEDVTDLSQYADYSISVSVDQGSWYEFSVVLLDTGTGGYPQVLDRCNCLFAVPVNTPTNYVELTDQYLNQSEIAGYLSFDTLNNGVANNNAYGADIQFQEYIESPDWDIMALSSTLLPTSGGAARANPTPAVYNVPYSDFKARFTQAELDLWWELSNKVAVVPGPPPTKAEAAEATALRAYMTKREINLRDPVVWIGLFWLESQDVLAPGRALQILTA